MKLPPVENLKQLRRLINEVPASEKPDLVQEAWLAYLSDDDVLQAVRKAKNLIRRDKRRYVSVMYWGNFQLSDKLA